MNPPNPPRTPVMGNQQEELLQQALNALSVIENGGSNFFSRVNGSIEKPYQPAQAQADYEQLVAQLTSVEAIITKLGLNDVVIAKDQSLEEILKKCSLASAEAYKEASSIGTRATIVQKSLSEQRPSQSL